MNRLSGTLTARQSRETQNGAALDKGPRSFDIGCLAEQLGLDWHETAEAARVRDNLIGAVQTWFDTSRRNYGGRAR